MKTRVLIIAAWTASALWGCSLSPEQMPADGIRTESLRGHIEMTRASIDNIGQFTWSDGDAVAVHRSVSGYETAPMTEDGIFNVHLNGTEVRDAYAIYPASIADETHSAAGDLSVNLPDSYSVGRDGMGFLAPLPMLAENDPQEEDLLFRHLGGILRLTLDNVPVETAKVKVSVGKRITGPFPVQTSAGTPCIQMDDAAADNVTFTLALPLTEMRNGIILNVPLPVGDYSVIEVRATDFRDAPLSECISSLGTAIHNSRADGYQANLMLSPVDARTIPLCIKAVRAGTVSISNPLGKTIETSSDMVTWTTRSDNEININLTWNECLYLRGDNISYSNGSAYMNISSDMKCYIYGNAMSLVAGADFVDATSLTGNYTFHRLFYGNTNITNHPGGLKLFLPATTVADYSYQEMFSGCTGLTAAPDLPATVLGVGCYLKMFYGCENLTSAQEELPATTLKDNCYEQMYYYCSALVEPPTLPATELASSCYEYMFYYCRSLLRSPDLPATVMAPSCYSNMFHGCYSLSQASTLPATTLANNCYGRMFAYCWSLENAPNLPATTLASNCYSGMFEYCQSLQSAPVLSATTMTNSCYSGMFLGCSALTSAPSLPATVLADSCYSGMFSGCTSIQEAPELPATTLAYMCYQGMFFGCTNLISAPELPVMTTARYCYYNMFSNCTSLTVAPDLPATTLTDYCYANMFAGCTELVSAPVLPAEELKSHCYYQMFNGCSKLDYIKALFTTTPESIYTYNWLNGVASTGTFVQNEAATWDVTGPDGIPSGWTVQTATN